MYPTLTRNNVPLPPSPRLQRHLSGTFQTRWVRNFYGPGPGLSAWWDPWEWFSSSAAEYVNGTKKIVDDVRRMISGQNLRLDAYMKQVSPYQNSSNARTQNAAASLRARIAGLLSVFDTLAARGNSLSSQLPGALNDENAKDLYAQAQGYKAQADEFMENLKGVKSDVQDLVDPGIMDKMEQGLTSVGLGIGGTLKNTTYIIGGVAALGLLAYMLAPGISSKIARRFV